MENTTQESPDRFDESSSPKANETESEMSFVETLDVCSRGLFMIRHFLGRFASKQGLKLHLASCSSHGTPVAYQDLDRPCSACNAHCGGDGIPASHATVTGLFVGIFAA
ncbi:MAG: hypothetical protein CM1200mP9_06640 [Gammaproteobacteria bacterium]|nr:MAG: hypothetical protein CM1200mP9_06640 [Gammaproteobacteria bacterium]